jgi:hypothetical protein
MTDVRPTEPAQPGQASGRGGGGEGGDVALKRKPVPLEGEHAKLRLAVQEGLRAWCAMRNLAA